MTAKKKLLTLTFVTALCALSGTVALSTRTVKADDTASVSAEFVIKNGASVRLASDAEVESGNPVNGIRFRSYITETYYENLLANYPNASDITLKSTVSKVVPDGATAPTPFTYEWNLTDSEAVSFNDDGVANFYHTINFKEMSDEYLKMANAFEMEADFWLEVTPDGATEATVIKADNASEADVTRSIRQVAYTTYVTPSTEEKPNPVYQNASLLRYFSLGSDTQAVYDLDVKTTALSSVAPEGVTADKAYILSDGDTTDVTTQTLEDIFTEAEASVSTTKNLVFFDADNKAYSVATRYVTLIMDTESEALTFFNDKTGITSSTPRTGYYLLDSDLSISVNLYGDRYFTNGTFDGDGHTLTVAIGASHYGGLFGRIDGVTVKNICFDVSKDFYGGTTGANALKNYASIFGYQTSNYAQCLFENVHLNLSRADGDEDANYATDGYPKLWLVGGYEGSTANNLVVDIADDFFIYEYSATLISWQIFGFGTKPSGCYMFSDTYELMKKNNSSWGTYSTSVSQAIDDGVDFTALTDTGYWTVDTENKALVFGKVA